MIVVLIPNAEMRKAITQPVMSGSSVLNCPVISRAKTVDANSARDAPAKLSLIHI